MLKRCFIVMMLCVVMAVFSSPAYARADRTDYPVVFAHGLLGFDEFLFINYWGDDYGTFVGDPCDGFLEVSCNRHIDKKQQAFAIAVNPTGSSDVRGLDNADQVESYMATVGAAHVNYIAHSQGGIDARKAAKVLYDRKGYRVVKVLVSVSSPHRGSPIAKAILDRDDGIEDALECLANNLVAPLFYGTAGDLEASLKALTYNDYDPGDGLDTSLKTYNEKYNIDNTYINHYASVLTAQEGARVNPILMLFGAVSTDIDGNGYCGPANDDCDNDGAAGSGNGVYNDYDDDGLVGINSQQMGYRLKYTQSWFSNKVSINSSMGYVSDINRPNETQSTSHASVLDQDHLDVTGIGIFADDFNEKKFYSAVIDYIADHE